MYTRAPSEVIHGRSFPAKSMICAVQLLMSKLDEVAPWHVIAATEICAARKGLLTGITNVVACSVLLEPKSTSASPPPNTTAYPALVRALSIGPCRFGVEPKRSEEHTSELQSHVNLVCRLLLEKKKKNILHPLYLKKKKKQKIIT